MFASLGRFGHRARAWVLAASALFVAFAAVWGFGVFDRVSEGGFEDPGSESVRADELLEEELGHEDTDVVAVYRSSELEIDNQMFVFSVEQMLDGIDEEKVVEVTSYLDEDLSDRERGALVSEDRHATYVPITLQGGDRQERLDTFAEIEEDLTAGQLDSYLGGPIPLEAELSEKAESDVVRAELVSLPLLLILLVAIFRGLVAALMPLTVGGLAILGSLTILRGLASVTEVSVFAINVATILGLGLAIDYGLFVVSRYREEYARSMHMETALTRTLATAGRTVAFSGVTVLIAFAGLLFFPQPIMRSIGLGGIAVVLFDVLAALVVLPALLSVIGGRIDALRLPLVRRTPTGAVAARTGAWARFAGHVMRRPALHIAVVGATLCAFAAALLQSDLGNTDHRYLPADSGSRVATESLEEDFPAGGVRQLDVAVVGDPGEEALDDYVSRLADLYGAEGAGVARTGDGITHVIVGYEGQVDDSETGDLVRNIREAPAPEGAEEILVGGMAAQQLDNVDAIVDAIPATLAFVTIVTFVLLFVAFGSVVLPLKAVLMGYLSLGASLGVVIWGFQEGHLAPVLGFDAVGTIDPTYLVLILIVAFGLAMDYELFLLSRVREEYLRSGDNSRSVAAGLQRTGSIITSAALLLVVVLAAMGTSDLLLLQIIGLGLAVAVVVDATLVRAILVPAAMRLLGRANWWLPRPLRWLYDRIGVNEHEGGDTATHGREEPGESGCSERAASGG